MPIAGRRAMKLGLAAMLALGACSFSSSALHDLARTRAVSDLACPSEKISVYDSSDGATVAHGCGAWTQYQCFKHVMGEQRGELYWRDVCVREAPAQRFASPPPPLPAPVSPNAQAEPRAPDAYP